MMKNQEWYSERLSRYVAKKYWKYADEIEWFVNVAPNIWRCFIPSINAIFMFTCCDNGIVTEERYQPSLANK